jgi:hypothetical protein
MRSVLSINSVKLGLVFVALTVAACGSGSAPPGPGTGTGTGPGTGDPTTGTGPTHGSPDAGFPGFPDAHTGTPDTGSTGPKKEFGAQCEKSADCQSDFCVFLTGGSSLGMCTQTCSDDIDCPGLGNQCVALSDAPQKVCVPK